MARKKKVEKVRKASKSKTVETDDAIPASIHDKLKNLVPKVISKEEVIVKIDTTKFPKPRHKLGESVLVDFIGTVRPATIIECRPHPTQPRWIYKVKDNTGTIIPWVGIDGQEQFSNIVDKKIKK